MVIARRKTCGVDRHLQIRRRLACRSRQRKPRGRRAGGKRYRRDRGAYRNTLSRRRIRTVLPKAEVKRWGKYGQPRLGRHRKTDRNQLGRKGVARYRDRSLVNTWR